MLFHQPHTCPRKVPAMTRAPCFTWQLCPKWVLLFTLTRYSGTQSSSVPRSTVMLESVPHHASPTLPSWGNGRGIPSVSRTSLYPQPPTEQLAPITVPARIRFPSIHAVLLANQGKRGPAKKINHQVGVSSNQLLDCAPLIGPWTKPQEASVRLVQWNPMR
jgi:hypothetical protein